jgi:hypothetical protein
MTLEQKALEQAIRASSGGVFDAPTARGCVICSSAALGVLFTRCTDDGVARLRALLPRLAHSAAPPEVRVRRVVYAVDAATRVALPARLDGDAPLDAALLRALPPITDAASVAIARDLLADLQTRHSTAPPGETRDEYCTRVYDHPIRFGLKLIEGALRLLAEAIPSQEVGNQLGGLVMATTRSFDILAYHDNGAALDILEAMLAMGESS